MSAVGSWEPCGGPSSRPSLGLCTGRGGWDLQHAVPKLLPPCCDQEDPTPSWQQRAELAARPPCSSASPCSEPRRLWSITSRPNNSPATQGSLHLTLSPGGVLSASPGCLLWAPCQILGSSTSRPRAQLQSFPLPVTPPLPHSPPKPCLSFKAELTHHLLHEAPSERPQLPASVGNELHGVHGHAPA